METGSVLFMTQEFSVKFGLLKMQNKRNQKFLQRFYTTYGYCGDKAYLGSTTIQYNRNIKIMFCKYVTKTKPALQPCNNEICKINE